MIKNITPLELKAKLNAQENVVVIDVRHEWELEISQLDFAQHIVLHELPMRQQEIPTNQTVVFMCRTGVRSLQAAQYLAMNGWPSENLLNLEGGILRWARDIDPSLPLSY